MAKQRRTAHAELDEFRQAAAAERVRGRDLEAQLEAAKARVDEASRAITAGFEVEDKRAVDGSRRALQAAESDVADLGYRVAAAGQRVERAQREVNRFQREHARDLLAEREQPGRAVALELSRAVAAVLKLHRAYLTERQTMDQLVAAVPGATPRADGPEATHPWELALGQLARAYQQTPQLEPPLPRWHGLEHRTTQDNSARRLQLQRRKRLTAAEETELDRINRELGVSGPRVEVA